MTNPLIFDLLMVQMLCGAGDSGLGARAGDGDVCAAAAAPRRHTADARRDPSPDSGKIILCPCRAHFYLHTENLNIANLYVATV